MHTQWGEKRERDGSLAERGDAWTCALAGGVSPYTSILKECYLYLLTA